MVNYKRYHISDSKSFYVLKNECTRLHTFESGMYLFEGKYWAVIDLQCGGVGGGEGGQTSHAYCITKTSAWLDYYQPHAEAEFLDKI
jgi:hypothetical protein